MGQCASSPLGNRIKNTILETKQNLFAKNTLKP